MSKLSDIVIVGGGSAGWMSAATFVKAYPDSNVTIIESPDYPIVGVGESTYDGFRKWLDFLEIKEEDFVVDTDATYKLTIKFTDFRELNDGSFHYAFGNPCIPELSKSGINDWFWRKRYNPEIECSEFNEVYYPSTHLANMDKMVDEYETFKLSRDSAFHIDAVKFGQWLKNNYCIPRGVNLIQDTMVNSTVSENGIDTITLKSGKVLTADLFVDCTGWSSKLLGESLKEPFVDYTNFLPNNRAWATRIPYTNKSKELHPYTECTAINNGWVWNIPLWSRFGTGYVYSDKFIGPDDALQEFKDHLNCDTDELEFKDISMRVGLHERIWVKNVLAIGLSAGFIEPLESNGLLSVHEFLLKFVDTVGKTYNGWDRDVFNLSAKSFFDDFAQFVALHYAWSKRDDTKYWKYVTDMERLPYVQSKREMNTFFNTASNAAFRSNQEWDYRYGYGPIAAGLDYNILGRLNAETWKDVLELTPEDIYDKLSNTALTQRNQWITDLTLEKTHEEYLNDRFYQGN
jgi:tryptophan halogenase|tara:strand:+ start:93 stop:1640 length:1548 start_codon:yes stop_codon:yes gene_type:complete